MKTCLLITGSKIIHSTRSYRRYPPPCPQEEVEAARAAAAPGWTGDIAWDEAVTVAMAEAPRVGEMQSEREARVLKSVIDADIVPESKLGKVGVGGGGGVGWVIW